jgi:NADH:ubiquinone oxidoreductase subunit 4 (subunit M)
MFLRDPDVDKGEIKLSPAQVIVLLVLVLPTLLFGVYFGPIVDLAQASVAMFGLR